MSARNLIDKKALSMNRQRALRKRVDGADFLMKFVAEDLVTRLETIVRDFKRAALLNEPGSRVFEMLDTQKNIDSVFASYSLEFLNGKQESLVAADDLVAFAQNSLDLIVSPLVGQFINDLPGLFVQVRRALRPDGLFLASFVGGSSLQELRSVLIEAESEITGTVSVRVLPFVDVRDAGGLLQRAGFALPVTDSDTLTVRYDDIYSLMRDLRAMGAQNPYADRSRKFLSRKVLERADALYRERYASEEGRISATFEIISVSGWAPHESQQKPLAPGSAKISLKDVL